MEAAGTYHADRRRCCDGAGHCLVRREGSRPYRLDGCAAHDHVLRLRDGINALQRDIRFQKSEKIPADFVGYFQTLVTFILSNAMAAAEHSSNDESDHHGCDHHASHGQGLSNQHLGAQHKPMSRGSSQRRTALSIHAKRLSGVSGSGSSHSLTDHDGHPSNALPALLQVERLLLCILDFLDQKCTYAETMSDFMDAEVCLYAKLRRLRVHEMETVEHVTTEMRKKLCRIHDISRKSIILPLYSLIDTLTVCLLGILISAKYSYEQSAYATIAIFGTLFVFVNLLVRDIDDPFTYPDQHHRKSYYSAQPESSTMRNSWTHSAAIDFDCLTIDFGQALRRQIAKAGKVETVDTGFVPDKSSVSLSSRFLSVLHSLNNATATSSQSPSASNASLSPHALAARNPLAVAAHAAAASAGSVGGAAAVKTQRAAAVSWARGNHGSSTQNHGSAGPLSSRPPSTLPASGTADMYARQFISNTNPALGLQPSIVLDAVDGAFGTDETEAEEDDDEAEGEDGRRDTFMMMPGQRQQPYHDSTGSTASVDPGEPLNSTSPHVASALGFSTAAVSITIGARRSSTASPCLCRRSKPAWTPGLACRPRPRRRSPRQRRRQSRSIPWLCVAHSVAEDQHVFWRRKACAF